MQAGFQVLKRHFAVDAEWTEKFATIPVANISDSMSRLNSGDAAGYRAKLEKLGCYFED